MYKSFLTSDYLNENSSHLNFVNQLNKLIDDHVVLLESAFTFTRLCPPSMNELQNHIESRLRTLKLLSFKVNQFNLNKLNNPLLGFFFSYNNSKCSFIGSLIKIKIKIKIQNPKSKFFLSKFFSTNNSPSNSKIFLQLQQVQLQQQVQQIQPQVNQMKEN